MRRVSAACRMLSCGDNRSHVSACTQVVSPKELIAAQRTQADGEVSMPNVTKKPETTTDITVRLLPTAEPSVRSPRQGCCSLPASKTAPVGTPHTIQLKLPCAPASSVSAGV
jgi:hypothetical protein